MLSRAARRVAMSAGAAPLSAAAATEPTAFTIEKNTWFKGGMPPFHLAVPVHSLEAARAFYGGALGLPEGRSSVRWIDFNLFGHQLVAHWVGDDYRAPEFRNPVDAEEVPVPHFGACLTVDQFRAVSGRLVAAGVRWVIPPTLRFKGQPGEQWTCFLKDPSNNSLEFKAMTTPANLFARYVVREG
jgi:extradiol dioxygenase family protein